jgi:hypothetical protein
MALVQQPLRYVKTIGNGTIECYHVKRKGGACLSTVAVTRHSLSAEDFAHALQTAAEWFRGIAAGTVKPEGA